ncbi:MAG: 16S rRNA (guanine(966)-N(2))-methyltransferase RsmD [Gammaproteobacteria bacterium]|nr:MAG: 16S rRNA (guanine(966)-N(2))-methyltransferase RsmD [Gammaproteobacteria bacterium]
MKNKPSPSNRAKQQLRIIGGQWRGRKLTFTPEQGLRPTLDRFRETLFNWLMFDIEGANCLDLFAGSGALGLEALSRGARQVTFIEKSKAAARQIEQHLTTLQCKQGAVINTDAIGWLERAKALSNDTCNTDAFDIVFLDPPFHSSLLQQALEKLLNNSYIKNHGYIYIEAENSFQLPPLPQGWQLNREKQVKNKVFFLLQKCSQI